ncbi:MAG: DEAD/DEAH box helicase [Bacteroidales bacterium]
MKTFKELGICSEILDAIAELGYESPMPVQEEVIPYMLAEDSDIVALAQTGTGKTAAFGLPIIQKIDVSNYTPQALILAPTRELCLQIASDLQDYSKYIDKLKVLPVYGGSSIDSQIRSLRNGVHIVVATPGRLLDLINRNTIKLGSVKFVIMDEADEMLNMGFLDSINEILAQIPEGRNTLLFSATMPKEIARIAKNYMKDPKEITCGNRNEGSNNVKHVYYLVHARDKYLALKRIADNNPNIYAIVFCRTRKETQEVADWLIKDGYNADSLHGELSQAQRDYVMQKFRLRNLQILVATDVAARGLDVDSLTHVINYGLPDDVETYNHRSGRTGRAGKKGTSIAIMHVKEKGKMREIERIIKRQFEKGEVPTGAQICEKQLFYFVDKLEKVEVNEEEIANYLPNVYRKLEWLSKEDLIKRCVSLEFNRLINYYRDAEDLEIVNEKAAREERSGRNASTKGYTRIFINIGKSEGLYPNTLIEFLNKNLGFRAQIGKIDLLKNFSYFEVEDKDVQEVLAALNNKLTYEGRTIFCEVAQERRNSGGSRGGDRRRSDDRGGYRGRSGEGRSGDRRFGSRDRGDRKEGGRDRRPSRNDRSEKSTDRLNKRKSRFEK